MKIIDLDDIEGQYAILWLNNAYAKVAIDH